MACGWPKAPPRRRRRAARDAAPSSRPTYAAKAREVADVTGADDTVIATLAAALASGATLVQAAELANHAAGVAVVQFRPRRRHAAELLEALD